MTRFPSNALLNLLKWLLRLATNRLCRSLVLLGTLVFRLCGVTRSSCFSKASKSARTGAIIGSAVPSISVTTDGDPPIPFPSGSQVNEVHNPMLPDSSASALKANSGVRMARSGSVSSGPSSPAAVGASRMSPFMYRPLPIPSTTASAISAPSGDRPALERELRPFGASQIDRYDRKVLIKMHRSPVRIRALQRDFEDPTDPSAKTPWISCTHPEGSLYFYHTQRRIFTDCDIRRTRIFDAIENCSDRLFRMAQEKGLDLPHSHIELALGFLTDKETKRKLCLYYFVDLERQLLFWLEDFDPSDMYGNVRGVKEPTHIKRALEMQYWWHCELYPYGRVFQSATFYELRGIVIHANAESITSDTSLAPFETGELSKMMDIMNVLEGTIGQRNDHLMCVVARFMRMFLRIQFFNFHGQLGARLDVDQSVYETPQERARTSTLLRILNMFLFGAPAVHAKGLKGVWVDMIVVQPRWKAFMANVNNEWAGFTIYSTVMLTVDISFLAVPGVDPGQSSYQPASVIAVYLSILCAAGSLVASVILLGQSQRAAYSTANATAEYISTMSTTLIGIDHLAIMYSVPYGLLMWGMLFFFTALSFVIFRSSYQITLIVTGIGMVVIAIFTFWPVWGGTERYLMDPALLTEALKKWTFMCIRSKGSGHRKGDSGRRQKSLRRGRSVSSVGDGPDPGSKNEHTGPPQLSNAV